MPIIKSATKQMGQDRKRRVRRLPFKTSMKTGVKKVLVAVKEGKVEDAKKALTEAYSLIDTARKKHIIEKNTASRRKSMLARALNGLENKKA